MAIFIALVWQTGALPLYDIDEGAFSEATREMLESGDFVTPRLNGELRTDKPVLTYWLQAASVSALNLNEFALRLPSVLAGFVWIWAMYRYVRAVGDEETAQFAALIIALSLIVTLVNRAAVSDAILNLFLSLTFFDMQRYAQVSRRSLLMRVYLWMGLGFLTKGPVAVMIPFVASGLFFASQQQLSRWTKAVFCPFGWLVFTAVNLPWFWAIYASQGTAFFEGFFIHHNFERFFSTFEGHGGTPFYYVVTGPLMFMPFGVLAVMAAARIRVAWRDPRERFSWLWFCATFTIFSFSSTQLPHYLVYGYTPLALLMASRGVSLRKSTMITLPAILLIALAVLLPEIFGLAQRWANDPFGRFLAEEGISAFTGAFRWWAAGALIAALCVVYFPSIKVWERLVLIGLIQAGLVYGAIAPRVLDVMQRPVIDLAEAAKGLAAPVVAFRLNQPSFSVYREAVTPKRTPQAGEVALVRFDRLNKLREAVGGAPSEVIAASGHLRLVRVGSKGPVGDLSKGTN